MEEEIHMTTVVCRIRSLYSNRVVGSSIELNSSICLLTCIVVLFGSHVDIVAVMHTAKKNIMVETA